MEFVTTHQPVALGQINTQPELLKRGPVTIRNLQDTEEDCQFSGRLMVEAFERKFIHATSKNSLPKIQELFAKMSRRRPPLYYERDFIAEYNGERAGSCVLRYHGDKDLFPDRDQDMPPLGCSDSCGLACLNCAVSGEDIPRGKCYVDHIGVDARFRGRGIGKVLLDMAEIDAKRRGCKAIYLWVATSNRAQHLYERQGYVLMEQYSLCGLLWCQTGEKEFARMEKILM
ncbi:uncharacterized protein LOC133178746 [Saccostrea echinata]|uniref:uncharacterized protein LOC133178746 n=1 Tax=Saccostrea echinata TaxID=191078 RepID=UPI002A7F3149|nr:uncharacterized protein LOC133178746 [Saccostrea echinata]